MTESAGSAWVGWRGDAVCAVVLAAAVGALFPDAVAGGVFFVQDVMVQNVPFRQHLHEALAAGRLPLWEPSINAGFPLFAEGQVGALYPPNAALAVLTSPARAVTLSVLLHLWLAATAAALLARRGLGLGIAAALTTGLAYGLSGYLVVRAMSPNFLAGAAGMPILLLLVEVGLRRGRLLPLAACGPLLAVLLLAGHAQAAAYGAIAAALIGLLRAWQWRRFGLALLGAGLALPGVAIAAVQVLPTWELASLSLRAGGIAYEQFVNMSLPPERLVSLLLPSYFGNSATGTYWGRELGFFIQLCPYIGVSTLALALFGARESTHAARALFAALAVLGLVLSLGRYTGLFEALYQVPLLRQFRIPTRFLMWWALGAAVLAGLGTERLLDGRPLRRAWWPVWGALVAIVVAAVVVHRAAPVEAGGLRALHTAEVTGDAVRALGALAFVALLGAGRLRRVAATPVGGAVMGVAVVVVLGAELHGFGAGFNGTVDEDVYQVTPPTAAAILEDLDDNPVARAADGVPPAGRVRVASAVRERPGGYDWHGGWALDTAAYRAYPATLRLYSGGLFGLANTLPGWSPLHLARHWAFASLHPRALALANTGYVVADVPLRSAPGPLLAGPFDGAAARLRVYRNDGALPRAYVVAGVAVVPADVDTARWLRSSAFDPRREAVLTPVPVAGRGLDREPLTPARIAVYEPERIVVDLPGRAGFLVVSDTHMPGWQARVDGAPRPLLRANHVFRAVAVDAGDQRVAMTYRPASLRRGVVVSAIGVLLWVAGVVATRRRTWPAVVDGGHLDLLPLVLQLAVIAMLHGVVTETDAWTRIPERLQPPARLGD